MQNSSGKHPQQYLSTFRQSTDLISTARNDNHLQMKIRFSDEQQQQASMDLEGVIGITKIRPPQINRIQNTLRKSNDQYNSKEINVATLPDDEELNASSVDSQRKQRSPKLYKMKMQTKIQTSNQRNRKQASKFDRARIQKFNDIQKNMIENQLRLQIESVQFQKSAVKGSKSPSSITGLNRGFLSKLQNMPILEEKSSQVTDQQQQTTERSSPQQSRQQSRERYQQKQPDRSRQHPSNRYQQSPTDRYQQQYPGVKVVVSPKNNSQLENRSSKHFQLAHLGNSRKSPQHIQLQREISKLHEEWGASFDKKRRNLLSQQNNYSSTCDGGGGGAGSRLSTAAGLTQNQHFNYIIQSIKGPTEQHSALKSNLPDIKSPKESQMSAYSFLRKSMDGQRRTDMRTQQQQSRYIASNDPNYQQLKKAAQQRKDVWSPKAKEQRDFSNTRGNQQLNSRNNVKPQELGLTKNKFPRENLLFDKFYTQQLNHINKLERRYQNKHDGGTGFLYTTQRASAIRKSMDQRSSPKSSVVTRIEIGTDKFILEGSKEGLEDQMLSLGKTNTATQENDKTHEYSPRTWKDMKTRKATKQKRSGSKKTKILMSPNVLALKSLSDQYVTFSNIDTQGQMTKSEERNPDETLQDTPAHTSNDNNINNLILQVNQKNLQEAPKIINLETARNIETAPVIRETSTSENQKLKEKGKPDKRRTSELQRIFEQFKDVKVTNHRFKRGSDADRVTELKEHSSQHSAGVNSMKGSSQHKLVNKKSIGLQLQLPTGDVSEKSRRMSTLMQNNFQKILKIKSNNKTSPATSEVMRLDQAEISEPSANEVSPIQNIKYNVYHKDALDLQQAMMNDPKNPQSQKKPTLVTQTVFKYEDFLQPLMSPLQPSRLSKLQHLRTTTNSSQQVAKFKQYDPFDMEQQQDSLIESCGKSTQTNLETPGGINSKLTASMMDHSFYFTNNLQQQNNSMMIMQQSNMTMRGHDVIQKQFHLDIDEKTASLNKLNNSAAQGSNYGDNMFMTDRATSMLRNSVFEQSKCSQQAAADSPPTHKNNIATAAGAAGDSQNAQKILIQRCMKHNFNKQRAELKKQKLKAVVDFNKFQESYLVNTKQSYLSQHSHGNDSLNQESKYYQLAAQSFTDSLTEQTEIVQDTTYRQDTTTFRSNLNQTSTSIKNNINKSQSPRGVKQQTTRHKRQKIRCSMPHSILQMNQLESSPRSKFLVDQRFAAGNVSKVSSNSKRKNRDLIDDMRNVSMNVSILENNAMQLQLQNKQQKMVKVAAARTRKPLMTNLTGNSSPMFMADDMMQNAHHQSSSQQSSLKGLIKPLMKKTTFVQQQAKGQCNKDSMLLEGSIKNQYKITEDINIKQPDNSQSTIVGQVIENSSMNSSQQKNTRKQINIQEHGKDGQSEMIKPPITEEQTIVDTTDKQKKENQRKVEQKQTWTQLNQRIDYIAQIDGWKNVREKIVQEHEYQVSLSGRDRSDTGQAIDSRINNTSQQQAIQDNNSKAQIESSTNRSAMQSTPEIQSKMQKTQLNSSQKLKESGGGGVGRAYQFEFQPKTSRNGNTNTQQLIGEVIVYDEKQPSILGPLELFNSSADNKQFMTFEESEQRVKTKLANSTVNNTIEDDVQKN